MLIFTHISTFLTCLPRGMHGTSEADCILTGGRPANMPSDCRGFVWITLLRFVLNCLHCCRKRHWLLLGFSIHALNQRHLTDWLSNWLRFVHNYFPCCKIKLLCFWARVFTLQINVTSWETYISMPRSPMWRDTVVILTDDSWSVWEICIACPFSCMSSININLPVDHASQTYPYNYHPSCPRLRCSDDAVTQHRRHLLWY